MTTPLATPRRRRKIVPVDNQQILMLMFDNISTKIDGIDLRVGHMQDTTAAGLKDVGERLTRVETLQSSLETSVKSMDSRILEVEKEMSMVPTLTDRLGNLEKDSRPSHNFFSFVRWGLLGLAGIGSSVVTAYVMHYLLALAT